MHLHGGAAVVNHYFSGSFRGLVEPTQTRRLLLHLMDEQELLLEESSLAAFTAGFQSAVGLAKELSQLTPYSFDKKERRAVSKIAPHKQRKAPQGQERGE